MIITRTTPLDQLPEFLTPAELKAFLGLSRATTYDLFDGAKCRRCASAD